jgi:hypothetical protein
MRKRVRVAGLIACTGLLFLAGHATLVLTSALQPPTRENVDRRVDGVASRAQPAADPRAQSAITGIVNAIVERRIAGGQLAREIDAVANRGAAAWVGYRVDIARRTTGALGPATIGGRCRLEPPTDLLILARMEAGSLVQLRAVAVDCDMDAAGMPLVWLDGVNPDESVAWLRSLIETTPASPRHIWAAALNALAYHAAPSAVPALTAIARSHPDRDVQRQAMVRIGQSTDPRAAEFLAEILD